MANFGWTGGDMGHVPTGPSVPGHGSSDDRLKKVDRRRQRLLDYLVPIGSVLALGTLITLGVVLTR